MNFASFDLLSWQAARSSGVSYSLADSGCQPLRVRDLLDNPVNLERLLEAELAYPPVRGTEQLRALIAQWHGGEPDGVIVTVGAAEANSVVVSTLVEPGDHVVSMTPGYFQVWGSCLNRGAEVEAFPLDPERGWRPDLDALLRVVRPGTKVISVTNPNNPAGIVLTEAEMAAIVAAADRVGAWIVADEVHRGTELTTDQLTPSFWGRHERVVCVGSLSKAFGMPGTRLGWLMAPSVLIPALWRRHEYATVSTSSVSMALGEIALSPEVCNRLLERYRSYLRESWTRLESWVDAHAGLLSVVRPEATALGLVRYHLDLPSTEVAESLYGRGGVLVAPGAHFGAEGHLRITHGHDPAYLAAALDRVSAVLKELAR